MNTAEKLANGLHDELNPEDYIPEPMTTTEKLIAQSIWRSGFMRDKNKVRQQAKESMRHLIATDIATTLSTNDRDSFMQACGF